MPKATRKKKLKAEDFQKKKLKVGKKKPAASTATDLSFRTQTVVVPNQTILENKPSTELVNSRNHSLKELLVQSRHYSTGVRKDAVVGVRDLFQRHPHALLSQLSPLFEALAKLIVDEDDDVRKALISLMQSFAPAVAKDQFRPFLSLVMAYTCSAMTHINEDIRLDGLKFLRIWLEQYPTLITMYSDKIIPNFLSLLSANAKGKSGSLSGSGSALIINPSSQLGSSKSRVEVLESLFAFLKLLLRTSDLRFWFLNGHEVNLKSHGGAASRRKMWNSARGVPIFDTQQCMSWAGIPNDDPTSSYKIDLFSAGQGPATSNDRLSISITKSAGSSDGIQSSYDLTSSEHLQSFIDILMPILVDLWIEASPNVFSAGTISQSPSLAVMHTVLKMMNLLWRTMLVSSNSSAAESWTINWFKTILKHLVIHFPFGSGNFSLRDSKVELVLQNMNILFSELLSHFVLAIGDSYADVTQWRVQVTEYMLEVLGSKTDRNTDSNMVVNLKIEDLEATFPVVWALLNRSNDVEAASLLKAMLSYNQNAHSVPLAKASFEFISNIVTHSRQYTGTFKITQDPALSTAVQKWISWLPRKLWELKTSNQDFSMQILIFLTQTLQRNILTDSQAIDTLQKSLVPFFHVQLAKGPVFGPFVELGDGCQREAVGLLCAVGVWGEKMCRGVVGCLNDLRLNSDTVAYALQLLDQRQASAVPALPVELYASVLATVGVVGYSAAELERMVGRGGRRVVGEGEAVGVKRGDGEGEDARGFWERRRVLSLTCAEILAARHNVLPVDVAQSMIPAFEEVLTHSFPLDAFYGITTIINGIASTPSRITDNVQALLSRVFVDAAVEVLAGFWREGQVVQPIAQRLCTETIQRSMILCSWLVGLVVGNVRGRVRALPTSSPDTTVEVAGLVKVVSRFVHGPELRDVVVGVEGVRDEVAGLLADVQVFVFDSGLVVKGSLLVPCKNTHFSVIRISRLY
ncbi:Testis-expressed sequence 10 protein [Rhizophlyctis rosea]|nr:Testis-expressed sequence 10 protein [Rhizophlyctis rosea]